MRGGAEHCGVSTAQPAQLWTPAQQVWLMATCPGRAVAVCGEKRAGRAMGRCAGDHKAAWAARGGRGCISRPMEGVEFRPKDPERPSCVWRAIPAERVGLCAGERMGVVFLFGAMAEKLGFIVTWIGTQYPDVEAFREVAPGRWQRVRVEVEFMSRNFLQHFHDPKECDLILCWENNWADCPVEVIALKGLVQTYSPQISADGR